MTLQEILRRQNEMARTAAPVVQEGAEHSAPAVVALSKEISKLSTAISSNDEKSNQRLKREEELTDSLKKLIKVIEIQTKGLGKVVGSNKDTSSVVETQETGTPGKLATGGLGETVGNKINAKEGALKEHAQASSGLRQLLLGGKSSAEIKKSSIFGFSSFVDKALSKREEKYAHKVEKKQYIEDAIKHDPTSYAREANFKGGMKTAEGRAVAEASAGKRFESIKEKEKEVTKVHDKIESAKEAGFAPLKKDMESREKATKNLVAVDTRLQAQFGEETPKTVESAPKAKRGANQTQQVQNSSNVVQFPNDPAAHAIPANVIEHNGAEALQPAVATVAQPAVAPAATVAPVAQPAVAPVATVATVAQPAVAPVATVAQPAVAPVATVAQPAVAPVAQPAVAPVATVAQPAVAPAAPAGQPTTMGTGAKQTAALFLPPTPIQTAGQPETVGAQAAIQAQLQAPIQAQIQAPIQAQIPQAVSPQVSDPQVSAPQTAVPELLQQEAAQQNETWREEEKTAAAESLANDKEIGKTLSNSLGIQKQQLEALTKIAESGGAGGGGAGGGGSLVDTALDVASSLPGKGAPGAAGRTASSLGGKAMNFLKGPGGKILGSVAAVGMGAYDAYSGWQDANKDQAASNESIEGQVRSGEITEAEGKKRKAEVDDKTDVKKGEAVGKGVGGASGALAGATAGAAIGSIIPGVGTVIGGAIGGGLGYFGGSKVGEQVGGALTSGYKSVKGMFGFGKDDEKAAEATPAAGAPAAGNVQKTTKIAGEPFVAGQPLSDKQMSVIEMSKSMGNSYSPEVEEQYNKQKQGGQAAGPAAANLSAGAPPPPNVAAGGPSGGGEAIQNTSRANADLKSEKESQANNIIVNAPTTNNSSGNQHRSPEIRAPLRNQDSTVNTYIDSRYR